MNALSRVSDKSPEIIYNDGIDVLRGEIAMNTFPIANIIPGYDLAKSPRLSVVRARQAVAAYENAGQLLHAEMCRLAQTVAERAVQDTVARCMQRVDAER